MLELREVRIKNFRVLKDVIVPLQRRTVIVGENNSGKTSFLELLELILSPLSRGVQISEQDFHHDVDPFTDAIELSVELRPTNGEHFDDSTKQLFYPHVDIEPDGRERLVIYVEVRYDAEQENFRAASRFVKTDGKLDEGSFLLYRKHVPYFSLDAIRDARRELSMRQGLWSRLTRTKSPEAGRLEEIRKTGEEVGRKLLEIALGDEAFSKMVTDFIEVLRSVLWAEGQEGTLDFSIVPDEFQDLV